MTTYPIAEMFHSVQGEGEHAGKPMTFVRLAGCNVGKPFTPSERAAQPWFPHYQERCTLWDGRQFTCDTNYQKSVRVSAREIVAFVGEGKLGRVLFTGGEPLLHDLRPLVEMLTTEPGIEHELYVETSGTLALPDYWPCTTWVAVSPKHGVLPAMLLRADELKVLVDDAFDERGLEFFRKYAGKVFLQPVNPEHSISREHAVRCVELVLKFPQMRVSLQNHKLIGVR